MGIKYLDMQAYVGITKHIGGREATDTLLSLCHIENAHEVLNVGCGIGVSSAYIAKKYNCHVVGVDISEKMIEWSRKRAREERVGSRVEFRMADILELPFETNRFDAVIVESVVAFVEDKVWAIRECVRVTRLGGYVGLNESFFTQEPTPELAKMIRRTFGDHQRLKMTMRLCAISLCPAFGRAGSRQKKNRTSQTSQMRSLTSHTQLRGIS